MLKQNDSSQNISSRIFLDENSIGYIGDITFSEYCCLADKYFPFVLRMIDFDRVKGEDFCNYIFWMNKLSWEFEDEKQQGRGNAYNLAQENPANRIVGTLSLLRLFSESFSCIPGKDKIILDVLAGNGTITRLLKAKTISAPTIISADISSFMVKSCLKEKLPCIRQSASYSLFEDSSLDGVLIAYGSHHLGEAERKLAMREAFRTIKPGGRAVLHDFEIGSPAAEWFDRVVHPFSRTGHPHSHFSKNEMYSLFKEAGFKDIQVFSMEDSFMLEGNTADEARYNALIHLYRMYDLVKIDGSLKDSLKKLESFVDEIFGGIEVIKTPFCWTAIIKRQSLVSVGTK